MADAVCLDSIHATHIYIYYKECTSILYNSHESKISIKCSTYKDSMRFQMQLLCCAVLDFILPPTDVEKALQTNFPFVNQTYSIY